MKLQESDRCTCVRLAASVANQQRAQAGHRGLLRRYGATEAAIRRHDISHVAAALDRIPEA